MLPGLTRIPSSISPGAFVIPMNKTEKQYRIATGGTEIGAFDIDALCTMWESQAIPKDTVYFHERSQSWKSLVKIFEARVPAAAPTGSRSSAVPAETGKETAARAVTAEIPPPPVAEYQTPVLTGIFVQAGWGIGIVGTLISLGTLLSVARNSSFVAALTTGVPLLLCTAAVTMLYFGMAQILDMLGRTAYHGKRTADASEASAALLRKGADPDKN